MQEYLDIIKHYVFEDYKAEAEAVLRVAVNNEVCEPALAEFYRVANSNCPNAVCMQIDYMKALLARHGLIEHKPWDTFGHLDFFLS
jgi:hypothetical protein